MEKLNIETIESNLDDIMDTLVVTYVAFEDGFTRSKKWVEKIEKSYRICDFLNSLFESIHKEDVEKLDELTDKLYNRLLYLKESQTLFEKQGDYDFLTRMSSVAFNSIYGVQRLIEGKGLMELEFKTSKNSDGFSLFSGMAEDDVNDKEFRKSILESLKKSTDKAINKYRKVLECIQ